MRIDRRHSRVILGLAILLLSAGAPGHAAPAPPKAKVVVAKSGGNYTTITAALNAINPSETNPHIIEVWPGTYTENVTMKSYVQLVGSGRDVTTIEAPVSTEDLILVGSTITNVGISGFTIRGASSGIRIQTSVTAPPVTIDRNTITGTSLSGIKAAGPNLVLVRDNIISNNNSYGISFTSPITIENNIIAGNGANGIDCFAGGVSVTIIGNTLSENQRGVACSVGAYGGGGSLQIIGNIITSNSYRGLDVGGTDVVISGNRIAGNGEGVQAGTGSGVTTGHITINGNTVTNNSGDGINLYGSITRVMHNVVTGNAPDLSSPNAHLSFNVFDTIAGSFFGSYNVNSQGVPWP